MEWDPASQSIRLKLLCGQREVAVVLLDASEMKTLHPAFGENFVIDVRRFNSEEVLATQIEQCVELLGDSIMRFEVAYAVKYLRSHPVLIESLDLIFELLAVKARNSRVNSERFQEYASQVREGLQAPEE